MSKLDAPPPTRHFCPECGSPHAADARFCESCGHRFAGSEAPTREQAVPATPYRPTTPQPTAPTPRRPTTAQAAAIAGVIVLLAAVAVTLVLVLGGDDDDAPQPDGSGAAATMRLAATIDPVARTNDALSVEMLALGKGDDPDDARASAQAAQGVVRFVATEVDRLALSGEATATRVRMRRALVRQRSFLSAALAALDSPSNARAANLGPRAQALRDAWEDTGISGAGGRIAGVDRLAAWTRDQVDRAEARRRAAAEDRAREQAEAEAKAEAEREREVVPEGTTSVDCGGFEGIEAVFAVGVSCEVALSAAVFQVSGEGSSEGYTCTITERLPDGLTSFTCSRGDGTQVNFSAYVG